jgi:hypothetical protein
MFEREENHVRAVNSAVADYILKMAREHHVAAKRSAHDSPAHCIPRSAGDDMRLDEIERLLIALQRSGHLSRIEMVKLLADYLREVKTSSVSARIRKMAEEHGVAYVRTARDALANHITRLAGDDLHLDEIEQLLIALQRSGYLSRVEMVKLQAAYLREARP